MKGDTFMNEQSSNQEGCQSTEANQSQNQAPEYSYTPIYTVTQKKKEYTLPESVGAVIVYLLAFLFCRSFPFTVYPLGCFAVCAITLLCTLIYLEKVKPEPSSALSYVFLVFSVMLCISPLITSNKLLIFLSYAAFFAVLLMFLFYRHKNGMGKPTAEYMLFDSLDAFFALPLLYTGGVGLFGAMLYPIKKGKFKAVGKQILYVFLGIILTLIPTYIVLYNLSYDSEFTKILSNIFRFDGIFELIGYGVSALFAIPLAMYCYSAVWQYQNSKSTDEQREKYKASHDQTKAQCKFLPAVSVITAAIPLMFLYVVFFISQIENYTSAFSGVLPEGFIYSDYARSGFFELCKVSALNAIFIFVSHTFSKNTNKAVEAAQKAVAVLLSLFSLCLIATAMAKMFLYIDVYGMTQKRVYVSLFMILMALGFLLCIFAQFIRKIKMTWVCLVLSALMLIIPSYANIDTIIASYNIDRYMDGTLSRLDYSAIDSIAAMPSLEKLYRSDKATKSDISRINALAIEVQTKLDGYMPLCFNIPSYKAYTTAERILENKT